MRETTHYLGRTLRPRMTLLPWLLYGTPVVVYRGFDAGLLGFGLLWFVAVYGVVVIMNDLADEEIDRLNRRLSIPFAQGMVTKKDMLQLMVGLSIVAVGP